MRALILIIGILCILAGGYLLLVIIGFASITDPSLDNSEWWAEFRDRIFNRALPEETFCLAWIALGSLLVWLGVWKKKEGKIKADLREL